ncbi:MAG: MFS transporter [Acidobacteriota bacterium]
MADSRVRYRVLLLTFITAFIMYIDRVCIGTAAPTIREEFGFDKVTMGWIFSAFSCGYMLFQIPGGWAADKYGPRKILTLSMLWWSIFTAATATALNAWSMAIYRFLFGVGEAAAFPTASRSLVRWLPIGRRAFGQGFQHAGSRLGAAVTPPIVVVMIAYFGWRSVFYSFAIIGGLWALLWYWYYRDYPEDHRGVNRAELEVLKLIGFEGKAESRQRVPWSKILRSRNLWALSLMYFCYGWVLWIYLAWLPTYLKDERGFTLIKMGIAASIPLLAATATNMLGGWFSDSLVRRLGDLRRGRLSVSIIGFSIAGLGLIPGAVVADATTALVCLTFALAGLELTVAVSWAICLDIGGEFSGSVSSVMNTLGNLGGFFSSIVVAYLATQFNWAVPFLVAAGLCVSAALIATQIDPRRSVVGEGVRP